MNQELVHQIIQTCGVLAYFTLRQSMYIAIILMFFALLAAWTGDKRTQEHYLKFLTKHKYYFILFSWAVTSVITGIEIYKDPSLHNPHIIWFYLSLNVCRDVAALWLGISAVEWVLEYFLYGRNK